MAAVAEDLHERARKLRSRRDRPLGFTSREVNLALEVLIVVSLVSGMASWMVALDRAWIATTIHSISGFAVVMLVPFKIRGPVTAGFRRGRWTRWVSTVFGLLVLAGIALGILHTTAIWWGTGYWAAMWTHLLFGFLSIPLFIWHLWTRPVRPGRTDVNRRSVLTAGVVTAASATVWGSQEAALHLIGGEGARRGGTGSHELASFDPPNMPRKQWIDDTAPRIAVEDWDLRVEGEPVSVAALAEKASTLTAWIDCTDGWRSQQRWDVVPLAGLLSDRPSRSVRVTSATGYRRLFARSDIDQLYLCVGYDGQPLARGHGAPVRLVVPNRRGPWWVKWVETVELADVPAWLQLPFPAT